MRIEPKNLVGRLSPTATRALESAVGRAATGQFEEIVPEHLLLVLLGPDEGECAAVCKALKVDRDRLAERVERGLERLRTGHTTRPVIARTVFRWLEDAWLHASLDLGEERIRSGVLFARFILDTDRYTPEAYPEFDRVSKEELERDLRMMLTGTAEAAESIAGREPSPTSVRGVGQPSSASDALSRFTTCFTALARDGKIDPVLGRHRETRQVIDILVRRRKNNPIIVGEPGVGKTALVEGLALAIVAGDVPDDLRDVEVHGLDLGALTAGAGVRGEFESRLKAVINEVKSSPKPIVLFIDEAHTLIGAGGSQGTSDAANLLKPELARGELRTIAATTWSEYKKYFEKDAALERRFQPVKLDEPTEEDAIAMLRGVVDRYEKAHGVTVRDEAVVAAVRLSRRYITGRQLPDKAVDLLDTAAARVRTSLRTKPEQIVAAQSELEGLDRAIRATDRDIADGTISDTRPREALDVSRAACVARLTALEERLVAERAALEAWQAAKRDATTRDDPRVIEAAAALAAIRGEEALIPSEVDADAIARVIESFTGVPASRMRAADVESVLDLDARLRTRIHGQDHAVSVVSETVRIARAGVGNLDAPLGVLLFVGTSGVGKTETALALADMLFGGDRFITTIAMSEFQEKHSVSRLIGSPPGYVGYGEGGVLTEAVRHKPYSVVLLDECEKADIEVMNLFYQVFDKGTLSDGEGRRVDFKNTLMILTSNLATDVIARLYESGDDVPVATVLDAIRPVLARHFKPALLARMTVVPFAPMSPRVLRSIAAQKIGKVATQLETRHGTKLEVSDIAIEELVQRCLVSESGARNVDHVLRGHVLPEISSRVLSALLAGQPPSRLSLGVDAERRFVVSEDM